MNIKKYIISYLVSAILAIPVFLGSVENSIIPTIEKFEYVENLPAQKYSRQQFSEITSVLKRKDECIRLVTYNVLFNRYDHNLDEENRWPQRLPRIVELLEEMRPDILSVQELFTNQFIDLRPHVEHTFAFYCRDCEDGELSGIFYRKERFELIDSKVCYMTCTPDIPSSATLTMVQLKDLKTGKMFAVFNAHLSSSNAEKRDFQARFIAKNIKSFAQRMPVILTGDLNTFPNRLDLEKLPFYDGDYIHRLLTAGVLKDSKDVSILGHLGPISTFSNASDDAIPFTGTGTPGVFLDHIYVSKGIQVLIHAVQAGTVNGHFPSDHLPVLIDFRCD